MKSRDGSPPKRGPWKPDVIVILSRGDAGVILAFHFGLTVTKFMLVFAAFMIVLGVLNYEVCLAALKWPAFLARRRVLARLQSSDQHEIGVM